jgi:NDP-sugar pyrophosphorylase family protein
MKTILICPTQASGVAALADSPVITLPFLGESIISHWLNALARQKVTEARLITSDDIEAIQKITGNGSRWGIELEIFHEPRDLSAAEARARYRPSYETDWLSEPNDVIEIDHMPGLPVVRRVVRGTEALAAEGYRSEADRAARMAAGRLDWA